MSFLLPLLLACASGTVGEGTSVGNPGEASGRMAPTDAVVLDRAELAVDALSWTPCDGTHPVSTSGGRLDLLGDATLRVPGGCWIGLELVPGGPLLLEGVASGGAPYQARLDLGTVALAAVQQLDVTDVSFVLELAHPDWAVDDDAALVLQVEGRSALYEDVDGDGWLDADERAAGVVMAGPEREADHSPDDTHDDDTHDDESESDDASHEDDSHEDDSHEDDSDEEDDAHEDDSDEDDSDEDASHEDGSDEDASHEDGSDEDASHDDGDESGHD